MDCSEFIDQLDAYLEERLDEDRRSAFRRHLRECSQCGDRARAVEPTLLFAMVESGPVDLGRIEACTAVVTAQIRQQRLTRRMRRRSRPWLAAAAAAALAVVSAGIWQLLPIGGEPTPGMSLDAVADADAGVAPPTVEVEMPGDDVRVYQFANDEDTETAVYFIVNPALEL